MNRRFLPSLRDHAGRFGAFATEWKGWTNPRNRDHLPKQGRVNVACLADAADVEDLVGCYAFLYLPNPATYADGSTRYVVYVGFSKQRSREIRAKAKGFKITDDRHFRFTSVDIADSRTAKAYEDDLIRYYCPTWNTRFSRQG